MTNRAELTRRARQRPSRRLDPHSDDAKTPLEWLSALAGRSTYTTPGSPGRTTVGPAISPPDIAAALAWSPDRLGASMALAITCGLESEWGKINELGYAHVRAHLAAQRLRPGVIDGPKLVRARIALRDAFLYLLNPARAPYSWADRASARGMAREDYRFCCEEATALLEHAANSAAKDAITSLFSDPGLRTGAPLALVLSDGARADVISAKTVAGLYDAALRAAPKLCMTNAQLGALIDEIMQDSTRTRMLGTLTLGGRQRAAVLAASPPLSPATCPHA